MLCHFQGLPTLKRFAPPCLTSSLEGGGGDGRPKGPKCDGHRVALSREVRPIFFWAGRLASSKQQASRWGKGGPNFSISSLTSGHPQSLVSDRNDRTGACLRTVLSRFAHSETHFGLMWVKTMIWPYLGLRGSNCNSEGTSPRYKPRLLVFSSLLEWPKPRVWAVLYAVKQVVYSYLL